MSAATLTDNQTLLAFKAGRSFRRAGTNFVDANPTKGAIVLSNTDDGLLRFVWKQRTMTSSSSGDDLDLMLFPGDAIFEKVTQAPGRRTYVLRFESSDQRHFFWMQDGSSRRDDEFVHNLNRLLADPNIIPVWDSRTAESSASTLTFGASTSQTAAASTTSTLPAGTTPEQLARLREIITSMGANAPPLPEDDVALTDILTPSNLLPLYASNPNLLASLLPHLPPDLLPSGSGPLTPQQTAQAAETLQRTVNSPPFRAAVAQLDRGLRTGALGGFVRSLGLPESAGTGVAAFLRAVAEQAREEQEGGGQEDRMEED